MAARRPYICAIHDCTKHANGTSYKQNENVAAQSIIVTKIAAFMLESRAYDAINAQCDVIIIYVLLNF